jgi:hypothetical protein
MKLWVAAVVVLIAGEVNAADVKVKGSGDTLTITAKGERHVYTLPQEAADVDMDRPLVLSSVRRDRTLYLLLDVTGPSRRGAPMARCGGGMESNIVWLKLEDWKLTDVRAVRHESCWHNIDGAFNSGKWKGDVYSLSFEDYEKKSTLTYDRTKPESAFSIAEMAQTK